MPWRAQSGPPGAIASSARCANDFIEAGCDDDIVLGLGGHDWLYDQHGADFLYCQDENDHIEGGIGADTLFDGTGDDTLRGDGSGFFHVSTGADRLISGEGSDTYRINRDQGIEVIIARDGELNQIVFGAGITFDVLDPRTSSRDVVITPASKLTVQIPNQRTWQGFGYLRFEEDSTPIPAMAAPLSRPPMLFRRHHSSR